MQIRNSKLCESCHRPELTHVVPRPRLWTGLLGRGSYVTDSLPLAEYVGVTY